MKQNFVEFTVEVNDIITPLSCSSVIIEFIKYIIYQKQIIPYPYERLKMYIDKKKLFLDSSQPNIEGQKQPINNISDSKHLISEKYFKKTQDVYYSLENIFKIITEQLTATNYDRIEEIVLLLGASFVNPQDVYRICIPSLNYSHLIKHHSVQNIWRNLFKTMINTEHFLEIVSNNSCTSNLHIMLKMKPNEIISSELFITREAFKLPTKGNQAIINFRSINSNTNCLCSTFKVFEDSVEKSNQLTLTNNEYVCSSKKKSSTINLNNTEVYNSWYQIKDSIKYFANTDINGVSVTDIWMNPKLLQGSKA